jgi:hypothetical protein
MHAPNSRVRKNAGWFTLEKKGYRRKEVAELLTTQGQFAYPNATSLLTHI